MNRAVVAYVRYFLDFMYKPMHNTYECNRKPITKLKWISLQLQLDDML